MSGLVQCRRRLLSHLANTRIRSYRPSVCAAAAAESESTLASEAPSVPQKKKSLLWGFLKYGCTAAIAGTAAAAGYITYGTLQCLLLLWTKSSLTLLIRMVWFSSVAYSVDELDEKTRAFRDSANAYTPPHGADTSSSLQVSQIFNLACYKINRNA